MKTSGETLNISFLMLQGRLKNSIEGFSCVAVLHQIRLGYVAGGSLTRIHRHVLSRSGGLVCWVMSARAT